MNASCPARRGFAVVSAQDLIDLFLSDSVAFGDDVVIITTLSSSSSQMIDGFMEHT